MIRHTCVQVLHHSTARCGNSLSRPVQQSKPSWARLGDWQSRWKYRLRKATQRLSLGYQQHSMIKHLEDQCTFCLTFTPFRTLTLPTWLLSISRWQIDPQKVLLMVTDSGSNMVKAWCHLLCQRQPVGLTATDEDDSEHSDDEEASTDQQSEEDDSVNKKHLKNVGPIHHCEPPHTACSNFTLPFTRCRYCQHHYQDEPKPAIAIAQAACDSSDTWWMAM